MSDSEICAVCFGWVRECGLRSAYIYPSGHILRPARTLTLSDWPAKEDLSTFCGKPITGKESSRLYEVRP